MNKKELIELMEKRGFLPIMECRDENEDLKVICFGTQPCLHGKLYLPTVYCEVNTEDNSYKLTFNIKVNTLSTPIFPSIKDEDKFNSVCAEFNTQAAVLHKYII